MIFSEKFFQFGPVKMNLILVNIYLRASTGELFSLNGFFFTEIRRQNEKDLIEFFQGLLKVLTQKRTQAVSNMYIKCERFWHRIYPQNIFHKLSNIYLNS